MKAGSLSNRRLSVPSEKEPSFVTVNSEMETLVRSQAVVARVVAGEMLLVPIRGKVGDLASIYSFNPTGSLIWNLLETPHTMTQLAAAIATAYEIEPGQAEQDVTKFVTEMKAVGLVEVPVAETSELR
jgi:Coenzyme PQQ synthesis protein D (PqqD)